MTDPPTTAAEWLQFLRESDDLEAIQYAKSWEENPTRFEARWLEHGDPAEDVTALCNECRRLRAKTKQLPSALLLDWAQQAQVLPSKPIGDQEADEPPGESMPRFRTGLARLDHKLGGGAYGMTVIAGPGKCGKSMLALSAAIESARSGWRVLYLNAELARTEMANRMIRYCGGGRVPIALSETLSIHPIEGGINIAHVVQKMRERVQIEDERWLVVVDSINRVVDMAQSGPSDNGYWYTLREWQEWLRQCAKASEGILASVVVSEFNTRGGAKGESLQYAADVCVYISRVKESEDTFTIDVPYARSSAGGHIGEFTLNWQTGRFEYVGDE